MKAELVRSKTKDQKIFAEQPISFNYENYGNGRWGVWVGTQVGKTFDKLNVAVFGEVERTFGNNNNEIKIDGSAKPVIGGLVQLGIVNRTISTVCSMMHIESKDCNESNLAYPSIQGAAMQNLASQGINPAEVAAIYVAGLPKDFSVDTKSTWEFAAGLKSLYEISNDWSAGGAFNWKHRATNSIKALNIVNTSTTPNAQTVAQITQGVANTFIGSMEDGVDEFALSLLGSRALTESLQLTLYGEYTFDTAEEKAQLGTTMKAELGLRLNWQF